MTMLRFRLLAVALLLPLGACAGGPVRPYLNETELQTRKNAWLQQQAAVAETERLRNLARLEAIARGETGDDTLDILLLSGGADWGAFAAGYLNGWREIPTADPLALPEFDYLAGISTGALIATYVVSGAPERYEEIEQLYRGSSPDWARFGGLFALLPGSAAVADNTGVVELIRGALTPELVQEIRRADADEVTLMVGTTNLDMGGGQRWDLGDEAARADVVERLNIILLAATSIPGAFPPVEIDGDLHADGAAVIGVPAVGSVEGLTRGITAFRARNPGVAVPKIRVWTIFNNSIGLAPTTVQPRWTAVLGRSYQTVAQTGLVAPLGRSILIAEIVRTQLDLEVEVRWVAVPDSFVSPEGAAPFDPKITNTLADLGREMGRKPTSWRTDPPTETPKSPEA